MHTADLVFVCFFLLFLMSQFTRCDAVFLCVVSGETVEVQSAVGATCNYSLFELYKVWYNELNIISKKRKKKVSRFHSRYTFTLFICKTLPVCYAGEVVAHCFPNFTHSNVKHINYPTCRLESTSSTL